MARIQGNPGVTQKRTFIGNRTPLAVAKEYRCSTGLAASFTTPPLAGAHLAPLQNLCQAKNNDILKGNLQFLEILVFWRLLCDTIPAHTRRESVAATAAHANSATRNTNEIADNANPAR
ncbi:MAG: hypothetical protein WAN72_06770 [Candidatus Acidiferrales bacterium]